MIIQLIAVLFVLFAPDGNKLSENKNIAQIQHEVRAELGPRISRDFY